MLVVWTVPGWGLKGHGVQGWPLFTDCGRPPLGRLLLDEDRVILGWLSSRWVGVGLPLGGSLLGVFL